MTRQEFEALAREQNVRRERERAESRRDGDPCDLVTMFALNHETYCRTHGVMGPCPYGGGR